jgi:excinuclease ABC subunit B
VGCRKNCYMISDKEGFLRSETSLIQTVGRAARNIDGTVIMYADTITESMRKAISETNRRRRIQMDYNKAHGITPRSIKKEVRDVIEATKIAEDKVKYGIRNDEALMEKEEIIKLIKKLTAEMKRVAADLQFERAAELRDKIAELNSKVEKG